jgi:hypothetical protein
MRNAGQEAEMTAAFMLGSLITLGRMSNDCPQPMTDLKMQATQATREITK